MHLLDLIRKVKHLGPPATLERTHTLRAAVLPVSLGSMPNGVSCRDAIGWVSLRHHEAVSPLPFVGSRLAGGGLRGPRPSLFAPTNVARAAGRARIPRVP